MNDYLKNKTTPHKIIKFRVGATHYAIEISCIQEIIRFTEFTTFPNSHYYIKGMHKFRDKVVTLFDMHNVLNVDTPYPDDSFIIVLNYAGCDISIHVDSVEDIFEVSHGNIVEPSAVFKKDDVNIDIIKAFIKHNSELLVLLDLQTLTALNCLTSK